MTFLCLSEFYLVLQCQNARIYFFTLSNSGYINPRYEAVDLRDGDKGTFLGNCVTRAVKNINEKISEALIGMDPTLQPQIDHAMIDLDKTEKKVVFLFSHVIKCNQLFSFFQISGQMFNILEDPILKLVGYLFNFAYELQLMQELLPL